MSEPLVASSEKRDATCSKCGKAIKETKMFGLYGSQMWTSETHEAPCGQPCWGASVHYKAVKFKQLHGHKDYPCPGCGKETKE